MKVINSLGIQNNINWHPNVIIAFIWATSEIYHVIYVDDDNKPFKITCKCCNVYVICSGKSVELTYITLLHAAMFTLGLYPEELSSEIFFFRWPVRTKMHIIYQRILKEGNGDHNCLKCTYFQYKNFDILRTSITLDKIDPVCSDSVKEKPTRNHAGFITY